MGTKLWAVVILDDGIKEGHSCSLNCSDISQSFIKRGKMLMLKFKNGKVIMLAQCTNTLKLE